MKSLLRTIIITLSIIQFSAIHAQDEIAFKSDIEKTVSEINTLSGEFKQLKTLSFLNDPIISIGNFHYNDSDFLKWEYISPYQYTIELSNGILKTTDGNNTNEINVGSSKVFKTINDIFIQSIKGDVFKNEDLFKIKVSQSEKNYDVVLTPKDQDLKEFVSEINLTFIRSNMLVNKVIIKEESGDQTELIFSNQKINE